MKQKDGRRMAEETWWYGEREAIKALHTVGTVWRPAVCESVGVTSE